MSRVSIIWRMVLGASLTIAALAAFAAPASAVPPVFDVGTGVVDISPTTPQYPGGYGYKTGPFIDTHDPLQARAFVVGSGNHVVALVSVDSTGWFGDYQLDNAGEGQTDTRTAAADVLAEHGFHADRSSVITSTTHVHAAPTVVGIWGPVDPDYLKLVHDAAVKAVSKAVSHMRPSTLWAATGNIRSIIWQNGQGTDHPDGFKVDENMPVLWARNPNTGATNGLYVNVPVHADEFNGADNLQFSADYPGYVRAKLDADFGTTAVLAQGTLGRQETPGSDDTYPEVVHQGEFIANAVELAMSKATPLRSDEVASDESYLRTPADNDDLLLAMNLNQIAPNLCLDSEEICTIPRSVDSPYLIDGDQIGAYVSTARIGGVVYFTNPGEAFPEVNEAIREGIHGARSANPIATAGDFLGYYYERGDYTSEQFGSSDFERYNVGPDLAQDNTDAALENAGRLGFETAPKLVHADFDSSVSSLPGVQFYPEHLESSSPAVNFYGSTAKAQHDGTAVSDIDWEFGDGTTGTSASSERFVHTFPGPGTYDVIARVTDANDGVRTWKQRVVIDQPLTLKPTIVARRSKKVDLELGSSGGEGDLIGASWKCPDGDTVRGLQVTCPAAGAGKATVDGIDGAGNEAKAKIAVPAPPRLELHLHARHHQPGPLQAKVKNRGGSAALNVEICAVGRHRPRVTPRCSEIGDLQAGDEETAHLQTGRSGTVVLRARAENTQSARARIHLG